jgi:hypothetical protein
MRILHSILTHDFFGSENHCAQLAAGQLALGHSVRVLVRGKNPQAVARFMQAVGRENMVGLPRWWPGFLEGWAARRVLAGFEPDVVHVHLGNAAKAVGRAARRMWATKRSNCSNCRSTWAMISTEDSNLSKFGDSDCSGVEVGDARVSVMVMVTL